LSQQPPGRLGRYEIEAELGRGMMGVVYRAQDPELHRTVALKTVRLAWAISDEEKETFEQRFLNEARVAARLSHPGIVVVHDVGRDAPSGTLYIALEFLEGRTLAEVTAGGAMLPWRDALRLVVRVAEALAHAHERGIVHRDVKPANIMLLPSGDPKIMDFGIAKLPTAHLTAAGEFFGTPSYMSPEQAASGSVDGRSDLFSLGAVLYLLLTGRRAFDAPGVTAILTKLASEDPLPPTRLVPGLPADVDYLVARALAKKPADRFPDGRAFAEDANDVLEGRPPRHREGWRTPRRVEGTLQAGLVPIEPETEDLRQPTPTLDARAPTLRRAPSTRALALGAAALALVVGLVGYARRGADAPRAASEPAGSDNPKAPPDSSATAETTSSAPGFLPRLFERRAKLDLRFEHPLRNGRLRVWVDDELVAERELQAPVTRKIVVLKRRKEVLEESFELRPGERNIRLQVTSGEDVYGSRIKGRFQPGETRRLSANLTGLIGKDLELAWGQPTDDSTPVPQ
jgi:serine/threonine protein kinase